MTKDLVIVTRPFVKVPTVLWQLANERRRRGLSQAALAELLGTKQSAISEMETYVVPPGLPVLLRYAHGMGMDIVLTPKLGN